MTEVRGRGTRMSVKVGRRPTKLKLFSRQLEQTYIVKDVTVNIAFFF